MQQWDKIVRKAEVRKETTDECKKQIYKKQYAGNEGDCDFFFAFLSLFFEEIEDGWNAGGFCAVVQRNGNDD